MTQLRPENVGSRDSLPRTLPTLGHHSANKTTKRAGGRAVGAGGRGWRGGGGVTERPHYGQETFISLRPGASRVPASKFLFDVTAARVLQTRPFFSTRSAQPRYRMPAEQNPSISGLFSFFFLSLFLHSQGKHTQKLLSAGGQHHCLDIAIAGLGATPTIVFRHCLDYPVFRHCLNCSITIPSLSELSCVPWLSELFHHYSVTV